MAVYLGNNPVSVYNGGQPIIVESGQYAWERYKYTPSYLSFIGNEEFTLKTKNTTKNWNGTLEYSTDTTTWNIWDGTEISSSGNNLYLRGIDNSVITGLIDGGTPADSSFVFTGTDTLRISCEGNIENLLDYETVGIGNHPTMDFHCYTGLFYECTSLTTAPELPATTLINMCYEYMFYGCTNLIIAPELPATTLANYCYEYMFKNCTSLTTPPNILPATTLAISCYYYMFDGCTSLTMAPELPATILAENCYYGMFYNCTSLTITPELSATTLADYCYRRMFYNCTSLITLPKLPATELFYRCYYQMFSNCTNIKLSSTQTEEYQTAYRIPLSGTGTEDPDFTLKALEDMFINTGGTFTGTPTINTTYYLSTSNTVV